MTQPLIHTAHDIVQHAQAAQSDAASDPWAAGSSDVANQAAASADSATNNATTDPWTAANNSYSSSAPDASHQAATQTSDSWLNVAPEQHQHFNILDPFHNTLIPLDRWVTDGIDWLVTHFRPVFQGIRVPVDFILSGFQHGLESLPAPLAIIILRCSPGRWPVWAWVSPRWFRW